MDQPLSPLNQGLNPLRGAPLWGQLVFLPAAAPAIDSQVAQPAAAAPLWLALQPYANARLCLFEVDRPESRNPVPIRRHVIDCFLEQGGIVSGYNDTALTDPGDVLLRGYLCRAAILPVSTSNTFDWLAAEQAWATPGFRDEAPLLGDLALLQPEGGLPSGGRAQFAGCQVMHFGADYGPGGIGLLVQPLLGEAIQLVLRPHSVLVLRDGDTLNLIAERYGTTESKLRSLNPVLEQSQPYVTREGETLSSVAAEQNLSLSLLRQFKAELSSWPSTEPLAAGTTLLLPVYRSTPPSRLECIYWCRGICPPRHCRRGSGSTCRPGVRRLLLLRRAWSL
jgi:LysM repeat protein